MLSPSAALEALLFASGEPLARKDGAKLLKMSENELQEAITGLKGQLEGRGITLIETERELELRTNPETLPLIKKLRENELSRDLGKAGLETLAIIAYQRGATRGEIDWVRGVNSSTSLRSLQLRGLVEGREDEKDRRRVRYEITTEALGHLGVTSLQHLPRFAELSKEAKEVIATSDGKL